MSLSDTQQAELTTITSNLGDKDSDVRRWAIYDLEQFAPEITIEYLVRGVADEHRAVREAAAEVLASVPSEICLRPLTPLLGSHRIEIRNLVATVVAKFGDAAVEYLLEALEYDNEDVRKFSVDILGLAQSDRAVKGLAKALHDPVENVGVAAAEALGKIQSPEALPHLIDGFNKRLYLKRECAEAMGLLNIPDGAQFLSEQLFAVDDLLIQYAMVDAMGNAGDQEVLEFLEGNITKIASLLHGAAALAMLKIARRQGINLLARASVPLDIVVQTAAEGNDEFQQILIDQLDETLDSSVLATLADAHDKLSSHTLVALMKAAALHSELAGFVLEMVNHEDDWVAYTAIENLGHWEETATVLKRVLGGSRNLPQLAAIKMIHQLELPEARELTTPFLDSEDEDLRGVAEQVLGI